MSSGAAKILAPFTPTQVEALNHWQQNPVVHPFTCARSASHPWDPEGDRGVLIATDAGWICRHCDYTQNWALAMMLLAWPSKLV